MSHENFNPNNNLQKRFEGKLAGGGEGEGRIELFDEEEEKKKKKRLEEMEHTREGKESAFDFVNERINQEITEILMERGVEGLDTEEYAKVRQEAIERAIEKMRQENPEFGAVVDEAEKIVKEESNKLTAALEKSGAGKEAIDESRRGFLKMLGIGTVVAVAGMAVSKSAEARQLSDKEIKYTRTYRELDYNNSQIRHLRLLTDDDIKSINEAKEKGYSEVGNAIKRILCGTVAGTGILVAITNPEISRREKLAVGFAGSMFGTFFGMLFEEVYHSESSAVLGRFIEKHNGPIDREAILKEISRLSARNEELLKNF